MKLSENAKWNGLVILAMLLMLVSWITLLYGCQQPSNNSSLTFEFHTHQDIIWRCNRKTGEVDEAVSGFPQEGWHRVEAGAK